MDCLEDMATNLEERGQAQALWVIQYTTPPFAQAPLSGLLGGCPHAWMSTITALGTGSRTDSLLRSPLPQQSRPLKPSPPARDRP